MLHNPKQPSIGHSLIILPTVDSSNNYAMQQIHDVKAAHGMAYLALEQTHGKGQRNKQWHTSQGLNIALSVVLEPQYILGVHQHFLLTAYAATAVHQLMHSLGIVCTIKWPNDIYIADNKAAGILIESKIQGHTWRYAVLGIGINVNEQDYSYMPFAATSLSIATGKQWDMVTLTRTLLNILSTGWHSFNAAAIISYYNAHLYQKNKPITLLNNGATLHTVLNSVNDAGALVCKDALYNYAAVEWVK